MSYSGFRPATVENELGSLNSTWSNIETELTTNAQGFIDTMSEGWFEGNAVKFFTEVYKPQIESMFTTAQSQLANIFSVINAAGDNHNATSDVSHFTRVEFNGASSACTMDATKILNISADGFVGIEDETFTTGETALTNIVENLGTAFNKLVEDVRDVAFEGGATNLQGTLETSVTTIASSFSTGFNNIIEGFNTALGGVKTVHEELVETTNTAFTVSEG